jgi:hypothetical protein
LLIHLADILAKLNVYKQVGFIARKQCGTIQPYLIGFLSSSSFFPLVFVRTKGEFARRGPVRATAQAMDKTREQGSDR